ncbi:MAG: hypothetical protein RL757_2920 [Bacteroidota bacterium]|jgi:hypothetical protein
MIKKNLGTAARVSFGFRQLPINKLIVFLTNVVKSMTAEKMFLTWTLDVEELQNDINNVVSHQKPEPMTKLERTLLENAVSQLLFQGSRVAMMAELTSKGEKWIIEAAGFDALEPRKSVITSLDTPTDVRVLHVVNLSGALEISFKPVPNARYYNILGMYEDETEYRIIANQTTTKVLLKGLTVKKRITIVICACGSNGVMSELSEPFSIIVA